MSTPAFSRNLVVAREAREDRQSSSVRRRPACRAHGIRPEIPHRAGAGLPAPARLGIEGEQLVEPARILVEQQRMTVAARGAAAFDVDGARDRVRDAIGLVGVVEGDALSRSLLRHDVERDADRLPLVEA